MVSAHHFLHCLFLQEVSPLLEDEKPSTFAVSTRAVAKNLI